MAQDEISPRDTADAGRLLEAFQKSYRRAEWVEISDHQPGSTVEVRTPATLPACSIRPAALEELKRRCLKLLGERIELSDHVKLGVMLSPKFKQLRMFTQQEREAVYNFPPSEDEEEQMMEASQGTGQDEPGGAFSQWEDVEDTVPADADELDRYLQLRTSPDATDNRDYVLKFWQKNAKIFPKMARLVRKTLCVPATSVSCEAAFSMSERTLESRRTHLGPASVNALLFLNSNM